MLLERRERVMVVQLAKHTSFAALPKSPKEGMGRAGATLSETDMLFEEERNQRDQVEDSGSEDGCCVGQKEVVRRGIARMD